MDGDDGAVAAAAAAAPRPLVTSDHTIRPSGRAQADSTGGGAWLVRRITYLGGSSSCRYCDGRAITGQLAKATEAVYVLFYRDGRAAMTSGDLTRYFVVHSTPETLVRLGNKPHVVRLSVCACGITAYVPLCISRYSVGDNHQ